MQYLVKHHSFACGSRRFFVLTKQASNPSHCLTETSFLRRSLDAVKMNNQAYYELYRRSRYYTNDIN